MSHLPQFDPNMPVKFRVHDAQHKLQQLDKTREKYLKSLNNSKILNKKIEKLPAEKKLNINTQGSGKVGGGGPSKNVSSSQKQHEEQMEQVKDVAFDYENEQSKDGKSESESESSNVPELVSVQPSQVGNTIGADFWENEEEGQLESMEREDIDVNEEREEEEEEEEEEE